MYLINLFYEIRMFETKDGFYVEFAIICRVKR